jgi:hypothetical protein
MSKDSFYFSHDYNSRTDDKIKKLIRFHGMEGYGIFWSIIENLYNNANAMQSDYEGIAYELRTTADIVEHIINDYELFCIEDGYFGSESVARRLEERNSKSETARQSAFKRWDKNKADANAMQTHSKGNAIKERKVKDIKENKYKNIPPTFEEINLRIKERNITSFTAEKFFAHYETNGWMVGKNKMKNWDSALTTWNTNKNFNNENSSGNSKRPIKRVNDGWN